MKQVKQFLMALLLLIIGTTLFSFSTKKWGGDIFEVYVNGKLLVKQFATTDKSVKEISLMQHAANEEVAFYYSHCGQQGKNRHITIKDGQDHLLKQWRIADEAKAMTCKIKDIALLQKKGDKLNVYYSSTELPGGRILVAIESGAVAKK